MWDSTESRTTELLCMCKQCTVLANCTVREAADSNRSAAKGVEQFCLYVLTGATDDRYQELATYTPTGRRN